MSMSMSSGCQRCRDGSGFSLPFPMAFQPIVDAVPGATSAPEARARPGGEGACTELSAAHDATRQALDRHGSVEATEMAAELGLTQFRPDAATIDLARFDGEAKPDRVGSPTRCRSVRGLDACPAERSDPRHTLRLPDESAITPLREGVAADDGLRAWRDLGVRRIQGDEPAKPAFERLPTPKFPEWDRSRAAG